MENITRQFIVTEQIYATNGQRFANFIIDYIMQLVVFIIYGVILGIFYALMGHEITDETTSNRLIDYLYGIIVLLFYYAFFEALFSRTVAKFITKTIVVDEYGNKPKAEKILLRTICRLIPFEAFSFIGTPSRGWHDRFSDTYVVQKDLLDRDRELFYSFEEIGKTEEE